MRTIFAHDRIRALRAAREIVPTYMAFTVFHVFIFEVMSLSKVVFPSTHCKNQRIRSDNKEERCKVGKYDGSREGPRWIGPM